MMKVMRGKARQTCELFKGQRFIEALLDMHERAQDTLFVESQRCISSRRIHLDNRLSDSDFNGLTVFAIFQGAGRISVNSGE